MNEEERKLVQENKIMKAILSIRVRTGLSLHEAYTLVKSG